MPNPLAVITGATGGIGTVVMRRLLASVYDVMAFGRTQAHCAALHEAAHVWTDEQSPQPRWNVVAATLPYETGNILAQQLSAMRRCDLLVCCHGAAPVIKPTLALTPEDIEAVWQTDVLGTLRVCQVVAPYMITQGHGSIIIVSSLHARQTYPERTAYSMAKSALSGLVRSLALEWGALGIRTNALLPWQVAGPRTTRFLEEAAQCGEDLQEAYLQRSPVRRMIRPEDVADAVLFLARNSACNGLELVMDGGVSQSMWFKPFLGKHDES